MIKLNTKMLKIFTNISTTRVSLILFISFGLCACTTPEKRKEWAQKRFGPRCEAAGYRAETPGYLECISDEDRTWRINQMEKGTPYENWMPMTYLPSITQDQK